MVSTRSYYLSELIGRPVLDPLGRPLGKLGDLVVRLGAPFPPVTGLALRLGAAGRGYSPLRAYLHWRQVGSVSPGGLQLLSARLDLQAFRRRPGELLLELDLLDQQVIDVHGRKLVRVNDVQLVASGPQQTDLRLAGIDVGAAGLLRRLELGPALGALDRWVGLRVPDRVIPWEQVEPVGWTELPPELQEEAAPGVPARALQLTHEKLALLHPADLADLVDQLSAPDRAAILEGLDAETAAETLGELEPETQGEVLEGLPTEAAVEILGELPPDEAADALAEVSASRAAELLEGMEAADAAAVRELLAYPEDVAGGMMTNAYVAVPAQMTASETIDMLRREAPPQEEVYYLYVVDEEELLVGGLSLRDLVVAPPQARLGEILHGYDEIAQVAVNTPADEVVRVMEKYDLLAVPVVDEGRHLVGVVTVDDALEVALPPEPRRRGRAHP